MPKTYCLFCGLHHRPTDELTCHKWLARITWQAMAKSQTTNIDSTLTMAIPVTDDGDELSQLTQGVREVSLDKWERSISADIDHLEKEEHIALLEECCIKLLGRSKSCEQSTEVREQACDKLEMDVDEARA